ncbi:MAG: hypothetical protein QOG22_872 [Pseudonocardiales bacterium]|jgi:hypothetical protein|nr:hypothetical protein [Pseudonocardiales bacterium]
MLLARGAWCAIDVAPGRAGTPAWLALGRVRHRLIAVAFTGLLVTVGCTGKSRPPSEPVVASCAVQSGPGFAWPTGMPRDLPLPHGAKLGTVRTLANGFTVVQFTSPSSLRNSLLFAITALQSAGYTAGRGIVGPSEIHLPFTKDGRPGAVRLLAINRCNTRWDIEA